MQPDPAHDVAWATLPRPWLGTGTTALLAGLFLATAQTSLEVRVLLVVGMIGVGWLLLRLRLRGPLAWASRLLVWCPVLAGCIVLTPGLPARWLIMACAIVLLLGTVEGAVALPLTSGLVALAYAGPALSTGRASPIGMGGGVALILGCGWYAARQGGAIRHATVASELSLERAAAARRVLERASRLTSVDVDRTLETITSSLQELGFDVAGVGELRDDAIHDLLTVGVPTGLPPTPVTVGVSGVAIRENRTVVVEDYVNHPYRFPGSPSGLASVVAAPLHVDGVPAGVLIAGSTTVRSVSGAERLAVEALAAQGSRALEVARRFREQRTLESRLSELDALKAEFLLSVTSDVRAPLTNVRGLSHTLEHRFDQLRDDERVLLLERLVENADRLHTLIVRLLDFSRLQTSATHGVVEGVDLALLASGIVSGLDPVSSARIRLTLTSHAEVAGDRDLLRHVVGELVDNALRHSSGAVQVRVTSVLAGVDVEVSDQGTGLPEAVVARLRGDDAVVPLGLGLTMVTQSLAVHDTRLHVRPGDGAALGFSLPARSAVPRGERLVAQS